MTSGHDYEHGEWDALAVGWAMSALDPDDEAIFLPHLANCGRCADTVAETTRTVGDIAWVVPQETPSPELRDRLMSAVLAEPRGVRRLPDRPAEPPTAPPPGPPAGWQSGPAPRPAQPPAGWPTGPVPAPAQPPWVPSADQTPPDRTPPDQRGYRTGRHAAAGPDEVVPLRRDGARRWRPLAAAAAVLAVVAGLGGWNLKLRGDIADRDRLAAAPARVAELDSASGQRVATVLVRGDRLDVVTQSVPPTDGTLYWVWGMKNPKDPNPVPIAGFDVTTSQLSVHTVGSAGKDLGGVSYFAVSREPAGRTPTAPTDLVALPGQAS